MKHKWIGLGFFVGFELLIGEQLAGVLRTIRNGTYPLDKLLKDPTVLFSWSHYKMIFLPDPLNLLLYVLILWTFLSGIKAALSGKVGERGNYDAVPEFGSGGTAKWMDDNEIKSLYYRSNQGTPLGSLKAGKKDSEGLRFVPYQRDGDYARLTPGPGKNENMWIIGPAGSNKTVSLALPMIFESIRLGESIVATDLKGELHEHTRMELEANGYKVYVLDFIKRQRGNHWNSIAALTADDEDEIRKMANAYVQGAKTAKNRPGNSDPLWEEAEENILAALIGYVLQLYPKKHHNFESIIKVLHRLKDSELAEELFEINGITGAPLSWYKDFLLVADSDKMRASIIGGLATNLSKLATRGIKAMISKNDFLIEDIAREKTAIFIMIPPNDKTFAAFITVFWQQLLDKLYNLAFVSSGKLPIPVNAILEEKANIGRIGTMPEVISTCRSIGLKVRIIYQDFNQPKRQYGEEWETIAGNCDTWIILGCNDNTSAKYVSDKLGQTTVKVQNTSTTKDGTQLLGKKSASESYNYQQRNLLTPSEVQLMPNDQLILFPRGKDPVLLNKVQYQHWKYRFCEPYPYMKLPMLDGLEASESREENAEGSTGMRLRQRAIPEDVLETASGLDPEKTGKGKELLQGERVSLTVASTTAQQKRSRSEYVDDDTAKSVEEEIAPDHKITLDEILGKRK